MAPRAMGTHLDELEVFGNTRALRHVANHERTGLCGELRVAEAHEVDHGLDDGVATVLAWAVLVRRGCPGWR